MHSKPKKNGKGQCFLSFIEKFKNQFLKATFPSLTGKQCKQFLTDIWALNECEKCATGFFLTWGSITLLLCWENVVGGNKEAPPRSEF